MKYLLVLLMLLATTFGYAAEKGGELKELRKQQHAQIHALRAEHQKEIDAFVADKPELKKMVESARKKRAESHKKTHDKDSCKDADHVKRKDRKKHRRGKASND